MYADDAITVQAIHPHWRDSLQLFEKKGVAVHCGNGSRGSYTLANGILQIFWDAYESERFVITNGIFVHESIAPNTGKIADLHYLSVGEGIFPVAKLSLLVPPTNYEVSVRVNTSDVPVFGAIFVNREYDSPHLPAEVNSIVDLGANIGLASIYFALRYPKAKIVAVEPDRSNAELLRLNTAKLGERMIVMEAAAWCDDGEINLHSEDETGFSLGAWGIQVSQRASPHNRRVPSFTMDTIMKMVQMNEIDVLKIDIEGAELEVFSKNAKRWLNKVKLIVVETHDRFRPGSEFAVRNALGNAFRELPSIGENLFFSRI